MSTRESTDWAEIDRLRAEVERLREENARLAEERQTYRSAFLDHDHRAERDAARAIADKYMEKAEQLTSDKGIAETREAAARADLAMAIELLRGHACGGRGTVHGYEHPVCESVAAFLAEMEKR